MNKKETIWIPFLDDTLSENGLHVPTLCILTDSQKYILNVPYFTNKKECETWCDENNKDKFILESKTFKEKWHLDELTDAIEYYLMDVLYQPNLRSDIKRFIKETYKN